LPGTSAAARGTRGSCARWNGRPRSSQRDGRTDLTWVDSLVLIWVALSALLGYQRGLAAQSLSLAGLALGALAGSRIAPLLLSGGHRSPWVPLASLIGALVGALLLHTLASFLGSAIRRVLMHGPLRVVDSLGGVVAGAALGLAVAWLAAAAALQVQGSTLRRTVQGSPILSTLVDAVPPRSVLKTLAQIDPLPLIAAPPDLQLPEPDGSVLRSSVPAAAGPSVVKILSVACGVGIQGSGWVVDRGLVATNTHVIAGGKGTKIAAQNGQVVSAVPVYVDAVNDVALLAVSGLRAPPLEAAAKPADEEEVVLLGYPGDGPLTAAKATAGLPTKVVAPDAYGRHHRLRTVVPLRGRVERGDSGGPVVNARGRVVAMMFAATTLGEGGFGVPVEEVLKGLESPLERVSSGPCAE